jgi:hypothetical protein
MPKVLTAYGYATDDKTLYSRASSPGQCSLYTNRCYDSASRDLFLAIWTDLSPGLKGVGAGGTLVVRGGIQLFITSS